MKTVAFVARCSWQIHLLGVVLVRPATGSGVGRVRSQITEVGKPRCIGRRGLACIGMPTQKLVGKKRGDAERLISVRLSFKSHDVISWSVSVRAQVGEPWRIRFAEVKHAVEARQHALICR